MRQKMQILGGRSSPRVFIVYKHRLFRDILTNLFDRAIVGAVERAAVPLGTMVDTITTARANVVIVESEADGNTALLILLSGAEIPRVLVLDMDREMIRDYEVRSSRIRSLEDLHDILGG